MSNNKRPRPAIPVLVHVDNQTEVDNTIVTKNVKSINETLGSPNDYSTNTSVVGLLKGIKENITGGGGGSGGGVDMTTVNTNTTKISNVLGDVSEESTSGTIVGQLKQTNQTLGTVRSTTESEDLFGKISTIRNYTENNNGKLVDIKKTIGEAGDVVSASTISGRLHSIAYVTGNQNDQASVNTISGKLSALRGTNNTIALYSETIRNNLGVSSDSSSSNTVIGLLKRIIENN